jgi:uncharacterized protein
VTILVDTSALLALLSSNDPGHEAATAWFEGPARSEHERLLTHSYVMLESAALVRARLGGEAVLSLFERILPLIEPLFVDEALHRTALAPHLANPRGPSLVDRVSFQVMRDLGIRTAFAFDRDFVREGFVTVP